MHATDLPSCSPGDREARTGRLLPGEGGWSARGGEADCEVDGEVSLCSRCVETCADQRAGQGAPEGESPNSVGLLLPEWARWAPALVSRPAATALGRSGLPYDLRMPSLTDRELVAACLEGKESAYALLVERYTPRLHRIARRICRHPEDAEDAVQEAFLQAVRDLRKWRPIAPLEAWLVTITVRTAQRIDQRSNRGDGRSESLDSPRQDGSHRELPDATAASDPAVAAGSADLAVRLNAAIAALPERYRVAISLRFQEGLSPKEISEALDLPERTVRTHLLRGLRALRASAGELE